MAAAIAPACNSAGAAMFGESRVADSGWLCRLPFAEIVVMDFEFNGGVGDNPVEPGGNDGNVSNPVCGVFLGLKSGRKVKLFQGKFGRAPPFPTDASVLYVTFEAHAEMGCFLALNWPVPERVLDLAVEVRNVTNVTLVKKGKGKFPTVESPRIAGLSLLGAAVCYGLRGITKSEKDEWRDLVLRGGPWPSKERVGILDYCDRDVELTAKLLTVMLPDILPNERTWEADFNRALFRGRYSGAATARMQWVGVPLDLDLFELIRRNKEPLQDLIIAESDAAFGVYEGRSFKAKRFEGYLIENNIDWVIKDGKLDLEDETFGEMALLYPQIAPLQDLRAFLSVLRLFKLPVGRDGCTRTVLWPFQSSTGRNQPSSSKFIFNLAICFRMLIEPPPGYGAVYLDFRNQEFGMAAWYSRDPAMLEAYESGEPYLKFGQQIGMVPSWGTKESHPTERKLCKACIFGTQYGQEAHGLSKRIGKPLIIARELLQQHRRKYRVFWSWLESIVPGAMAISWIQTVFGWRLKITRDYNLRTIQNYTMQANAAEMLHVAICLGTERGIDIAAPVHDAVLIIAPLDRLDSDIARMKDCMREASKIVLGGYELGIDVEIQAGRDPSGEPAKGSAGRFVDPDGIDMWNRLMGALAKVDPNFCAADYLLEKAHR